jgi:hypothetical protein
MDCEWSCICVLGVSNFPLSTILIFVLELFWQCGILCFHFITRCYLRQCCSPCYISGLPFCTVCLEHFNWHIISLRGEVWTHKTRLVPPLLIEVPVLSQAFEGLCICVLGVSILPLVFTIFSYILENILWCCIWQNDNKFVHWIMQYLFEKAYRDSRRVIFVWRTNNMFY